MCTKRFIGILFFLFALYGTSFAQDLVGFRVALNSGVLADEFGKTDNIHSTVRDNSAVFSDKRFTPQLAFGLEGEILFQISENAFFGIEVDYSHLKGYNNNPPWFNYYLTPYFEEFQGNDEYTGAPIQYNTRLINLAVNYKYFFFPEKEFQPFVKLTGVVAFVGTELSYKDSTIDERNILYARGTSHSNQKKWPVFHAGAGLGFSYDISDKTAFQIDGTITVVNSGIVDGVPNFTYNQSKDVLSYNRRLSITLQISAGLVYFIEVKKSRKSSGKTNSNLPFYRKIR